MPDMSHENWPSFQNEERGLGYSGSLLLLLSLLWQVVLIYYTVHVHDKSKYIIMMMPEMQVL